MFYAEFALDPLCFFLPKTIQPWDLKPHTPVPLHVPPKRLEGHSPSTKSNYPL